jgi:hypothetical protein
VDGGNIILPNMVAISLRANGNVKNQLYRQQEIERMGSWPFKKALNKIILPFFLLILLITLFDPSSFLNQVKFGSSQCFDMHMDFLLLYLLYDIGEKGRIYSQSA